MPVRALSILIAIATMLIVASGCATKKDTSYRRSTLLSPLNIPSGLDAPAYTETMDIPPAPASAPVLGEKEDIERPPAIARGQADANPAGEADSGAEDSRPAREPRRRRPSGEVDERGDRPYP